NLGLAETVELAKNSVSAKGGQYPGNFSFGQVETIPTEQNKVLLVSSTGINGKGRPAKELASYSQYDWYTNSIRTGAVRGGSTDVFSYGIDINNRRILNLFPNGTLEVAKINLKDYSNFDSHYKETINQAKNAYPITGGRLNGELAASNVVISQGDGRQHFALRDNDGKTRAYIYKDKGGDGIRVNNGYDGGGDWVFSKDGGLYCPGTINTYLSHTIRHTGYGRINFVHQSTGDYIYLETTQDGKGIYFVQRNKGNQNQWVLNFPQKNGVVATTDDVANISNIPVGVPLPWPQNKPPAGYLICNGDRFDKAKYPKLALAYPSGVLPDLRGEFIRGLDAGRNVDSGRQVLSWQGDEFKSHNHEFEAIRNETGNSVWGDFFGTGSDHGRRKYPVSNSGGKETRPRNVAFLYIVRAA
ncbi:phage tail protein, partial [Xenorhabdus khoisanae]|uniref:phage tail protein n=1 Tax=Xenorhabdus khoisanae TaxID=880157 RepID=UPI0032B7B652